MFSVFKGYKTPSDEKLFENIQHDGIYFKPNIIKFAKQNNKTALYQIGDAYYNLQTRIGYLKALDWYQKSAAAGSGIAQNRIGEMFHHGRGVTKDYSQALRWYLKAAENGCSAAHNNLGTMYYDGKGVKPDHADALTCFSVAANQGYCDAQFNLAWMYDREHSPVHDKLEAIKWYTKAAEQGHEEAAKRVVNLNRKGIRYHPNLGASQQSRQKSVATNKTRNDGKVINQQNSRTIPKIDTTISSNQIQNMVDTNQQHQRTVTSINEGRKDENKKEEDKKLELEIQRQEKLLKEIKIQKELEIEKEIEKQKKLQKEKEKELEHIKAKNKEQVKAMRQLQETIEQERLEREAEKKREQEEIQAKLKALETKIEEMNIKAYTLETGSSSQLPEEIIVINKPDEKDRDTKEQEDEPDMIMERNFTPLVGSLSKRQSKQLSTSDVEIGYCEKESVVEEKVAVEHDINEQSSSYNDSDDYDDYQNDLCLDDSSDESDTEYDYKNDIYYDDPL